MSYADVGHTCPAHSAFRVCSPPHRNCSKKKAGLAARFECPRPTASYGFFFFAFSVELVAEVPFAEVPSVAAPLVDAVVVLLLSDWSPVVVAGLLLSD